jgi:hypothetical protein
MTNHVLEVLVCGLAVLGCEAGMEPEASPSDGAVAEQQAALPIPRPRPTCDGRCGGQALLGRCWCDAACVPYGDCCGDYQAECGICQVGARRWGTSEVIGEQTGFFDYGVKVSLAANGDGLAVWQATQGVYGFTVASRVNGVWAPARTFTTTNGSQPGVVVGRGGHGFVYQRSGAAIYHAGDQWQSLPTHDDLRAAVDNSGNVMLLHAAGARLVASLLDAGSRTWGSPSDLGALGSRERIGSGIEISTGSSGRFAAIWVEGRSLHAARFAPASGWETLPAVDALSDDFDGQFPQVSLADDGRILAAWIDAGNVYARRYSGSAWEARSTLSTRADSAGAQSLRLAVNRTGEGVAAWSASSQAWVSSFNPKASIFGPSWLAPIALTSTYGAIHAGIDDCGAREVLVVRSDLSLMAYSQEPANSATTWNPSGVQIDRACGAALPPYGTDEAATSAYGVTTTLARARGTGPHPICAVTLK